MPAIDPSTQTTRSCTIGSANDCPVGYACLYSSGLRRNQCCGLSAGKTIRFFPRNKIFKIFRFQVALINRSLLSTALVAARRHASAKVVVLLASPARPVRLEVSFAALQILLFLNLSHYHQPYLLPFPFLQLHLQVFSKNFPKFS